ncbi:DnaJ homolog subfamily B member 4 [Coccomyxa sp. Obi]|nr:DnaJ homolog subfamily B member 4 [Coccomyxa sp. Obi]
MPTDKGPKNLYETLGVGIDATDEELRRAFRRKAARVHPDKVNAENRERATLEFQQLTDAVEVLSDAEKRRSYDLTGAPDSFIRRKKTAHRQSPDSSLQQLFKDFFERDYGGLSGFSGSSTYSFESRGAGGAFTSGFSTYAAFSTSSATKDQELPLTLTLEEVSRGGEKDLTITRRLTDGVSGRLITVDEAVALQLTPGIREGTRIVLRGRGDEVPGRGCSDVILVVREALHPQFERRGDDLITCVSLPLVQALTADSISVPMLDGSHLQVPLSGPITPETVLRLPGKGMPIPEQPGKAGNLCVRFRIAFPSTVTPLQKGQLQAVLQ